MIDWLGLVALAFALGWLGRGLLLQRERRELAELDRRLDRLEQQRRRDIAALEGMFDKD